MAANIFSENSYHMEKIWAGKIISCSPTSSRPAFQSSIKNVNRFVIDTEGVVQSSQSTKIQEISRRIRIWWSRALVWPSLKSSFLGPGWPAGQSAGQPANKSSEKIFAAILDGQPPGSAANKFSENLLAADFDGWPPKLAANIISENSLAEIAT